MNYLCPANSILRKIGFVKKNVFTNIVGKTLCAVNCFLQIVRFEISKSNLFSSKRYRT